MATVGGVDTAIRTAVLGATTATVAKTAPLSKDFSITAGATYIKTLAVVAGQDTGDANVNYIVGSFSVTVCHKLSDSTDENTYVTGNMLTDQAALMVRSFWRGITGVRNILDGPELSVPERIGNVIEYTITAQLSITP